MTATRNSCAELRLARFPFDRCAKSKLWAMMPLLRTALAGLRTSNPDERCRTIGTAGGNGTEASSRNTAEACVTYAPCTFRGTDFSDEAIEMCFRKKDVKPVFGALEDDFSQARAGSNRPIKDSPVLGQTVAADVVLEPLF